MLHSAGITYYSSRYIVLRPTTDHSSLFHEISYWAVAIPVYGLLCIVMILVVTFACDLTMTVPLDSFYTIAGECWR